MDRRSIVAYVLAWSVFASSAASALSDAFPKGVSRPVRKADTNAPITPGRLVGTSSAVYRYDSLGRLVLDQRPGTTLTYTYDAAGNRVQSTVQH
jgi:YD repeat-containing protein